MLLASVASIRGDYGFDDMTDVNAAISAALHSVEAQLASTLQTDFAQRTYTDIFYVYAPGYILDGHYETEFKLRRGFVTVTSVLSGPTLDALTIDLLSSTLVNAEKGIVKDIATLYAASYVAITYQAGFAVDGSDPTSYNLTLVPTWLQEAAKLKARLRLNNSPSIIEAGLSQDKDIFESQYDAIMADKFRYAPLGLLPL